MARPPRPIAPDLTYHVTARGNRRQEIHSDDHDHRRFLAELSAVVEGMGWLVETYCLMPNHVHLLVRTPRPNLSAGMQLLLGRYARHHNDRHGRSGHLFQGRFHSVVVTRDAHHVELFRYVALNPVRGGVSATAAGYPWSAHAALMGLVPAPRFLDMRLHAFGGDRVRYASLVESASPSPLTDLLGDGSPERLQAAAAEGVTQSEMAEALGVTQPTVSRRLRA